MNKWLDKLKTPLMQRWLIIALIVAVVVVLALIDVLLFRSGWKLFGTSWGWVFLGLIVALLIVVIVIVGPQLLKLYRFQKHFKEHEKQLLTLPSLMKSGHTQEAITRFERMMKDAPDSAFLHYTRAFYMQAAGKYPEALHSANKALSLVSSDPLLLPQLQQNGGQMGQPTTVEGFKEQLEELRRTLEPRVRQMRERREKAVKDRKKKSR